MNQRRRLTMVAAAATLLATAPMATVFATWTWLIDSMLAVGAVAGAALLVRSTRAPAWTQVPAMLAGLTLLVTLLFGTHAIAGLIPTGGTLRHFGTLFNQAAVDIREQSIPVPDRNGLLFLTTAGIGLVAVAVDLLAVGLRQPALAGMPMLPLYSIPVILHDDSTSVLAFAIGAIGFLWLLASDNVEKVRRFGRRFTGDGRDIDLWEPSPLAAAGRRLAALGVVLAIVLPLGVPGMTSGMLDRVGGNGNGTGTGGSGNGPGVNLFAMLSGSLNQDRVFDMLRVTTNDPTPYYLRFGVADQVTRAGFVNRSPVTGDQVTSGLPDPTVSLPGVQQRTFHADVDIIAFGMPLLPVYTQISDTRGLNGDWRYDSTGQLVYSPRSITRSGMKYSFDYVRTEYAPSALRQAGPVDPESVIGSRYTQVPRVRYVDDLVTTLTKGRTTEYDQVLALYDHFAAKNGFSYQLTTKTGTSGNDIVDFLTNKQGYCEQYAAALAWLVRAAGFPSRVAFGFTRGNNSQGGRYTLNNLDLHAWTEVYFPGYGWVPFDATPSSSIPGPVSTIWAPDVNQNGKITDSNGGLDIPGANASAGAEGSAAPHDPGRRDDAAGGSPGKRPAPTWPWWTLGSVLGLLVLLSAPAARRFALRRRRRDVARPRGRGPEAPGPGRDAATGQARAVPAGEDHATWVARSRAHAAWDELLDIMIDYRIPVEDSQTPRATVALLIRRLRLDGAPADGVRLLGQAEERARYARMPLPASGLAPALRQLRTAVTGQVSLRTRLGAVLMPPSVLRRWRASANQGVSGSVAWLGRAQQAIFRVAVPRRLRPHRDPVR